LNDVSNGARLNGVLPNCTGTAPYLPDFAAITLAQLDASAPLFSRQDRKYIVPEEVLDEALGEWSQNFDVLEIDGNRSFLYRSLYFDDNRYSNFHDHHMGRRIRFKVRTRHYVDTDTYYLEMKLKGTRGRTLKSRLLHLPESITALDAVALEYINRTYFDVYRRPLHAELTPAIRVDYIRTTLVAKQGGARITIDRNLAFTSGSEVFTVDAGKAVLETKSDNGNAIADRTLRRLHQHPVPRCSKYCIGLAALGRVDRYNNFRAAMRKLNVSAAF